MAVTMATAMATIRIVGITVIMVVVDGLTCPWFVQFRTVIGIKSRGLGACRAASGG